jgi:hypothetical protein
MIEAAQTGSWWPVSAALLGSGSVDASSCHDSWSVLRSPSPMNTCAQTL